MEGVSSSGIDTGPPDIRENCVWFGTLTFQASTGISESIPSERLGRQLGGKRLDVLFCLIPRSHIK